MSTFYCYSCGKAIQYSITKPASCPACGKLLKTTVVTASPVVVPVQDAPAYQVVVPSQKGKAAKRYNVIPEPKSLSRARIMEEDLADGVAAEGGADTGGEGDNDETPLSEAYDVNAAKQLARELVAGIDPSTIHIGKDDREDDGPVKFGDLVRQRAAMEKQ